MQPILVTELIFTLALRVLWLGDRIAARTWGAAALLCAGLVGFLVVGPPAGGTRPPTTGRWVVALCTRAMVIVVLLVAQPMGLAGPAGRPPRGGGRHWCGRSTPPS